MTARRRSRTAEADTKPPRSKATFDLDSALLAELRAAVVSVPLTKVGGSLSGLVEGALSRELEKLRRRFNQGKPFVAPKGVAVPRGRPPRKDT